MGRSRDAAPDNAAGAAGASGPTQHRYRLVNVFAEEPLSGNALCVFEDGRPLSDGQMQALALQLNLSETTFILPSDRATARVRIFTPGFEMPFAGHPTLGTAHVVRSLHDAGDAITPEIFSCDTARSSRIPAPGRRARTSVGGSSCAAPRCPSR
jgi:hypothetical protein